MVSDPCVPALGVADEPCPWDVRGGVARALERPIQIVLEANDQRRRRNALKRITRDRLPDRPVIQQPLLTFAEREQVLHHLARTRLLLRTGRREDVGRRRKDGLYDQRRRGLQRRPV